MSERPKPAGRPSEEAPAVPTEWEKNWAMIAHMGSFVGAWVALGLLAPLYVMLTKGKESEYVRRHAVESLNFQINALIWMVISVLLFFFVIGIFMLAIVGIWYLIAVILGSLAASKGRRFRYKYIIRFVK